MNFESISKFHFKPIEKEMKSQMETFRISNNRVSMTQAMYIRMKEPEHLLFAYDAEERAIGIKIVGADEPKQIEVVKKGEGNAYIRNSKYICDKIAGEMKVDLEKKCIVLRRGYILDGWYVFELRYADVVNRSGRKKEL